MEKKSITKDEQKLELSEDKKLIADKEAYDKYKALANHPIFNERRFVTCSDGNVVDVASFPQRIKNQTAHLSQDEQELVMEVYRLYRRMSGKLVGLKTKAFGTGLFSYKNKSNNNIRPKRVKILDKVKDEVLSLFGRMFTIDEIHQIVVEDFKIPTSKVSILEFRKLHLEEITELIESFKTTINDMRLATKRGRLEELIYLYHSMKTKYKRTTGIPEHRSLLMSIEQIRKEIEGDRITLDGNLDISVDSKINQHLQQEVFKQVNINQLILSRVCARTGVDPLYVLKELAESYYSKYLGIVGEEVEFTDVLYPSSDSYDFDKIKDKTKENEEQLQEYKDELYQFRQNTNLSSGLDIKNMLKIKLENEKSLIAAKETKVEKTIIDSEIRIESGGHDYGRKEGDKYNSNTFKAKEAHKLHLKKKVKARRNLED